MAIFITKSASAKHWHRPLRGVESLETRTVLSAGLSSGACFDLAIRGTDIQYSALGLPAAMGGDVYLAEQGATSHASIGRYEESLTPS